jgi:D-tagatose-1,6-bisphosphate aldolase subunit GatZ/KbaZ
MAEHPLIELANDVALGRRRAVTSVCSAHPLVIEATLLQGLKQRGPVLIEATCNQVNQDGGYTGMTPAQFRAFVETIAVNVGFPLERLILGGDHLGPNPWKALPAEVAMSKARAMVEAYARAGFSKLHLDTSMGCVDDPTPVPREDLIAARAAGLAAAAEEASRQARHSGPVYVIGTEVPVPGGALEQLDILEVTRPEDAIRTVDLHRNAFEAAGMNDAFARCVGVVVQPGVEFGNENVVKYDPDSASPLSAALGQIPGFVYEAHSTDYQPRNCLAALVRGGFAILKVGPGLTFALREALYGLDEIAAELGLIDSGDRLKTVMERTMLLEPSHWEGYYSGSLSHQQVQRHFSYSDRIRYYWPRPEAQAAIGHLFSVFKDRSIPAPLISQYLGGLYSAVMEGQVEPRPRALLLASIQRILGDYDYAGGQSLPS